MKIKTIKQATNYYITSEGKVYNSNTGREVVQSTNGKRDYNQVILIDNEGNKKKFYTHRLVAEAFIPNPKNKPEVGHLKTRRDNTVEDLCWCTPLENREYQRDQKPYSSKYLGVCFDKRRNKWIAQISINKKSTYLGQFESEDQAAEAVKQARKNGKR